MKNQLSQFYILCLILLDIFHPNLGQNQFIGTSPKVTFKRIEKCAEDAAGFKLDLDVHKFNRSHYGMNFNLYSPYDFGPEIQINLTVSIWGDGGWKPHVLDIYEPDGCECMMKYARNKFKEILRMKNIPEKCPIPKGSYDLNNYIYDGQAKIPLIYGDFKTEVYFSRYGTVLSCVRIFAQVGPNENSKSRFG